MRCTINCTDPACQGECAEGTRRTFTATEQARLDAYLDRKHPRVYPRPTRLHVVTMPSPTDANEHGACEQTMTCPCRRCEIARQQIKPRSERNADPFRRAA